MAAGEKLFGGLAIEIEALRLEERALVPVEAEPAHAFEDALDHFFRGALEVGVFDAQDKGSAEVAGEEPVEEGGAGSADVEIAGRGRRKTDARGAFR